jgi:long-chain acyl-CoA synthetase
VLWTALAKQPGAAIALDDLARRQVSFAELRRVVSEVADELARQQVSSVLLLAGNSVPAVVLCLSAWRAGVSLTPVAPFASDGQLDHILQLSTPDLVITDDLARASRATGRQANQADQTRDGLHWLRTGVSGRHTDADLITFTSGSTDRPKGACLSQATLTTVAGSLRSVTGMSAGDRHHCLHPLAQLLEWVGGILRPLLAGARVLIPDLPTVGVSEGAQLEGSRMLGVLADQRVTSTILVPQMLETLVAALEDDPATRLPDLRFVGVGGAVVPLGLLLRAERVGLPVHQGYGLTECGSVVALNSPDATLRGSVGRCLPHARVEIAPDGEILVGGALFDGYLGGAAPGLRSGMLPTGDLGSIDAQGFLHIRGRKQNSFATASGRNINPEWLESRLVDSRFIRQAVVFGEGLPGPVAILVVEPGSGQGMADDLCALNRSLPDHARIRRHLAVGEAFSTRNGQWTSTGRPRRTGILRAYRHFILGPGESAPECPPASLPDTDLVNP